MASYWLTLMATVLVHSAGLTVASADSCSPCKCLKGEVDCDSRDLTEIPTDLPPTTKVLYFRNNRLTTLSNLSYSLLEELHVDGNVIDTISDDAFSGYVGLEVLSLASNNLSNFPFSQNTFKGLAFLKILNLSSNGISELEDEAFFYKDLKTLKILDLSRNGLHTIGTNAFTDIATLDTLDLSHNKLLDLSTHFQAMSKLKKLDISYNYLKTLPTGVFADLRGSDVQINASYNNIDRIGLGIFQNLNSVRELDLSHNNLSLVPLNAVNTDSVLRVNELILNFNKFTSILPPDDTSATNGVKSLILTNAKMLTTIERFALSACSQLETVNISNNSKLVHIDSEAFGDATTALRHVSLANNSLRSLGSSLLPWMRLEILDLSGNRWHCDSDLIWMKQVLPKYKNTSGAVVCSTPASLQGRNILDVPDSDFAPTSTPQLTDNGKVALIVCLVSVSVLTLVSALVYKFRHRIFYRRPGRYKTIHNAYTFGGQETIASYDGDESARLTSKSTGPVNV